ncbi:TRAP transporter substrate-binding protein [Azospirillum sp. RWY-5-1]|uniref:TRAP transporter substrate-binding protein n=1 Tax=Azospirillum oleiclasticum TaxID=2735135 RepID=A0ABX2T9L3_9PROT|nr:TRAP transporter substrate-binding protein [Azospirillum oleiclasticum]NYZ13951.1 TRAP transporter substrate-binding protein [Azospirillum oleiclasticum]NYZ20874.1 TRAP transporter substrate-binding protein [Azospirillum oleiclasticum]
MKSIIAGIVLSLAAVSALPAAAQEHTLKYSFADVDQPSENAAAAHAYVFKDTLERLTGGRMKVDLFPNAQLGDAKSMAQQIRRGTIGVASFSSGVFASLYYPKLGVIDLPFLYTTRANMVEVLSTENDYVRNLLDTIAKETGVRILGFEPYGFRNFTTAAKPVQGPGDLKGLKMRTQEIVPHQEMMRSLGATPTPIPFMELYSSLQTGVVDGQENPLATILQQKYFQVQKHLTLSGHLMTIAGIFVNEKWYQGLPADLRQAVLTAHREASLAYAGIGAVQDVVALKTLQQQGMQVYTPTPGQLEGFRKATTTAVRGWAEKEYGKEFVDGFFAHVAKVSR